MKKLSYIVGLALILVLLLNSNVHADVDIVATASKSRVKPGESFDIVVEYKGTGEKITGIQFLPILPAGIAIIHKANDAGWPMPGDVIAYTKSAAASEEVQITLTCSTSADAKGTLAIRFDNVRWSAEDSYTSTGTLPTVSVEILSDGTVEPTPAPSLPGDANGDGAIDILDLVAIIDHIVSGTEPKSMENANANGDNAIDILDLVWVIDVIVGG